VVQATTTNAEAIVESVSLLHSHRLREAAGGDREAVQEADAAEQDQAIIGEVDAELDREQVAREDRVGASIDQTGELEVL
jgi:hypothetical protein